MSFWLVLQCVLTPPNPPTHDSRKGDRSTRHTLRQPDLKRILGRSIHPSCTHIRWWSYGHQHSPDQLYVALSFRSFRFFRSVSSQNRGMNHYNSDHTGIGHLMRPFSLFPSDTDLVKIVVPTKDVLGRLTPGGGQTVEPLGCYRSSPRHPHFE